MSNMEKLEERINTLGIILNGSITEDLTDDNQQDLGEGKVFISSEKRRDDAREELRSIYNSLTDRHCKELTNKQLGRRWFAAEHPALYNTAVAGCLLSYITGAIGLVYLILHFQK